MNPIPDKRSAANSRKATGNILPRFLFPLALLLAAAATAAADQPPPLDEAMIRNVILTWYTGTNDHHPVEHLLPMLAEDVEMRYPNRPEPFIGKDAFKEWYADVLKTYFDETHHIEACDIKVDGNSATAAVVVRWERRTWEPGEAKSKYAASLSYQTIVFARDPSNGRITIRKKSVDKFDPTAPIFGVGN
jgi:hypothetical protein